MKKINLAYLMLMTSLMTVVLPANVLATSDEETQVQAKADEITKEIDSLIVTINNKYEKMAELEETISSSKEKIETTQSSIATTEKNILKRMDSVGEQLQSMQLKSVGDTPFTTLLTADNFSDFFNRAYAITVLGTAQKEKIHALNSEQLSLQELEQDLIDTQKDLDEKKAEAKTEETSLDEKLSGLKRTLADNSSVLAGLAKERVEKENSKRESAIKVAAKLVQERETSKESQKESDKDVVEVTETKLDSETSTESLEELIESSAKESEKNTEDSTDTEVTNSKEESFEETGTETSKEKPLPKPTPVPEEKPSTPSGSSMSGQATAYTATGNMTATGTKPGVHRTIAVDPSVIPLGSSVKITVPSMPAYSGVYIAEDTGGVVHGNIIDIFVGNDQEARDFGRRAIQFEVL